MAPFEEFAANIGILNELRIVFAAMGLADLVLVSFVVWKPHKLSSVRTAFLLAYLGLDTIAVYGLALILIGGSRFDFYGFAAPALSGMLALSSQGERWDSLATAERQEDFIQPPT